MNDNDLNLLRQHLDGQLSEADSDQLLARFAADPVLCDRLVEEALLHSKLESWASEETLTHQAMSSAPMHRRFMQSWLMHAVFVLLPPVLVFVASRYIGDYGLAMNGWRETAQAELRPIAGVVLSLIALSWLGVQHWKLLRHPWLGGIGGTITLLLGTMTSQSILDDYSERELDRRERLIQEPRWISYDSVFYWPKDQTKLTGHPLQEPTPAQIRQELKVLREAGFDGLFLHECRSGIAATASIARELGFKGVVQGIRVADPRRLDDPDLQAQMANAIGQTEFVDAYCLGELSAREVDLTKLKQMLARIRRETGKPVTTSFLHDDYLGARGDQLRELEDFTVRGLLRPWKLDREADPDRAVQAVKTAVESFRSDTKPSLLTFVYFPSDGNPAFTEQAQERFWKGVLEIRLPRGTNIVSFNSFDRPWAKRLSELNPNVPAYEGHTGLFAIQTLTDAGEVKFRAKPALHAFPDTVSPKESLK